MRGGRKTGGGKKEQVPVGKELWKESYLNGVIRKLGSTSSLLM